LLLSVINVSVQTVEIVNALPNIDFSAEQNEDYVVKMYSNSDENENLNIAAEPDNEYL
jgi:hypothetical protein